MTLRLVLVSLVAGLGLGLPAWPKIEGWVDSTQKWMNARLAEIDVRRGEEKQYVVIHDLLAAEMERARAARLARRTRTVEPPVAPHMATIALPHPTSPRHRAEMLAGRPATAAVALTLPFALPKLDDFLTAAGSSVATTEPESAPEPVVVAARFDDLARLAWDRFGDAGTRLAEGIVQGLRDAEARESLDLAFAALESSDNLYFDGEFALQSDVAPAPEPELVAAAETAPARVVETPAAPAPLPGFEVLEQSADLYFAAPLVDESAPAPEAFAAAPAPVAEAAPLPSVADAGVVALPDDVFAPIAPVIAGLAEAAHLPTVADADFAALPDDVFAPADPMVASLAEPEPTVPPEVNRAVRLTREALGAWVNVLTGPAVVTASHTASVTR
ncbi:hypothetical protein [Paludisphaera soli]|uniref:hypothetical protein n=1 Tax=Paludisphaera soli TaxID=2712865 RepID=UPI0013EABBF6|nr:hypothetical protein [Paludisphaera soli]